MASQCPDGDNVAETLITACSVFGSGSSPWRYERAAATALWSRSPTSGCTDPVDGFLRKPVRIIGHNVRAHSRIFLQHVITRYIPFPDSCFWPRGLLIFVEFESARSGDGRVGLPRKNARIIGHNARAQSRISAQHVRTRHIPFADS